MPLIYRHKEYSICKFNNLNHSFKGTDVQQAKCLLRFVNKQGSGSKSQLIPEFLLNRVGRPIQIAQKSLQLFLEKNGIGHSEIGGTPFEPLTHSIGKDGKRHPTKYFVIHDTSSPEYSVAEGFPSNINDNSWSANKIGSSYWKSVSRRVNGIVNRIGKSYTFINFKENRPSVAIKLEQSDFVPDSKNRFIHIENIQPRLKPTGSWAHIAPEPGFTIPQYRRLSLLYIAASVRAKRWLVPAFHFNIDHKISPKLHAHDDPQNFDLNGWAQQIKMLESEILAVDKSTGDRAELNKSECTIEALDVTLNRNGTKTTIALPANGMFFGEGHYVTTEDSFDHGRNFPAAMTPQPAGYPPPIQCNEAIDIHLQRSLSVYRTFDSAMTLSRLYPDKWARWWTPKEGGNCGQGSVGNAQLRRLTIDKEMWFFTLNWASGHRPKMDTRFLVSANGRYVVVVGGYETGPGGIDKLGGITREVHGWLETDNSSKINVAYLKDQNLTLGPINCSN